MASRATVKSNFQTGDSPTQADFEQFLDSIPFLSEVNAFTDTVTATKFFVSALNTAPANAADTGTAGEIRFTAAHIYLCTATDTWKRVAIATW